MTDHSTSPKFPSRNAAPRPLIPAFVTLRDDAPSYWSQDILWIMHATAATTGGSYSLIEELCPRGSGAPPHIHMWSTETFYVLEGEITFLADREQKVLGAGGFISIPPNTVHGFRVDSPTSRILNMYVPASWEEAVIAMGQPAPRRELPPKGLPHPDQTSAMIMMMKYGMTPIDMQDPLRP